MKKHIYLRAYMAGIVVPTIILLAVATVAALHWLTRRAPANFARSPRYRCRQSSELFHPRLCRARLPHRRTPWTTRLLPRLEVSGRLPQSGARDRLKPGAPDLSAGTVFDLHKPTPFRGCLVLPNATKVNPHCSSHPEPNRLFWIE